MTVEERVLRSIMSWAPLVQEQARKFFDFDEAGKCDFESELERLFAWSVCSYAVMSGRDFEFDWYGLTDIKDIKSRGEMGTHRDTLHTQTQIGKHRVDFLFSVRLADMSYKHFAVECDGHDFHEKTKEQAQRDKSRDRALQHAGVHVLRFTGKEIYQDPLGCAQESFEFSDKLFMDHAMGLASRVAKIESALKREAAE